MNLSAVVITENEELNIERCLRSLAFCNEIIVVDSGSSDDTEAIARKSSALFVKHPWAGFARQKNFANSIAQYDWILSVDADEEVPDDLRVEIVAVMRSIALSGDPSQPTAFSVPRRTLYGAQWIQHGGWYPNRVVRLMNKRFGTWVSVPVHEYWQTTGRIVELQRDLIHHSFSGIEDQVERNNRYSSLGSQRLYQDNTRFSLVRLLLTPTTKFIETYFWKRGFLDGILGLIIAVSASYSVFLKWAKLWELRSREAQS